MSGTGIDLQDYKPGHPSFPPLPTIRNEKIRLQVFTHRSLYARPTHVFEDHPDDLSPDNEKYEHLGDSVLGLVVTNLMFDMYQGLKVGPSTKIRALIVGNATLAEISLKYKLPDQLRVHASQALSLRASAHVQADVFESFVGGLYIDQGLPAVQTWLRALFRPYVVAAYKIVRSQHGLPPLSNTPQPLQPSTNHPQHHNSPSTPASPTSTSPMTTIGHLALFNQILSKNNREVEWVYSDSTGEEQQQQAEKSEGELLKKKKGTMASTPVWSVKVLVDGEYYGTGKGNTKKSARNDAAKVGLKRLGVNV